MDDEIKVPVSLPLDDDGFLRRECPTCEREFKWFSHSEGDPNAEEVSQYFCPLCGAPADTNSWWTPAQLERAQGLAGPEIDRLVQDSVRNMFKGFKGFKGFTFTPNSDFSFDNPTPSLVEPRDMVIAEPPCHPNEPVKVPNNSTDAIHCLICGNQFSV
jgi:ribosomal protein S27E